MLSPTLQALTANLEKLLAPFEISKQKLIVAGILDKLGKRVHLNEADLAAIQTLDSQDNDLILIASNDLILRNLKEEGCDILLNKYHQLNNPHVSFLDPPAIIIIGPNVIINTNPQPYEILPPGLPENPPNNSGVEDQDNEVRFSR